MKIKRRPLIFCLSFLIIVTVSISYFFKPKQKEEKQPTYHYEMMLNNSKLNQKTYEVDESQSNKKYRYITFSYKKGEELKGYKLTQNQTFDTLVQLTGPSNDDLIDGLEATKVAYNFKLTGNIIKKTDKDTNKEYYEINNGSIDTTRIPYVLSDDGKYVTYKNNSKTKRVKYDTFIKSLKK